MRTRLAAEAEELASLLAAHGFRIVGGTSLFVLAEHPDARARHVMLARRGIWTRAFAEHATWLRFGLPGAGLARLKRALSEF
jgi:cobalamin biosynthetic protein CobC